jgi:hypothetical protein
MTPLEFLQEEFKNVKRALKETLRYDFVPDRSKRYYDECKGRLAEVERAIAALSPGDIEKIAAKIFELSQLANWISLIERSHLGEFSWPFAEVLDDMASALLFEKDMKGDQLNPIIHVIASGSDYRISYEPQVPATSKRQRFIIVEFPRSLKHHVLLHAIFGHELCHTAIHTSAAGGLIHSNVLPPLLAGSAFLDLKAANGWLNDTTAPQEIAPTVKGGFQITQEIWVNWMVELICDLFGLLLFGPSFLGAHRAVLAPMHPFPYELQESHPPYALRHRMLVRAMHVLGWSQTVTSTADGAFFAAESDLLSYLLQDPYVPWCTAFPDAAIEGAVSGIRAIFAMKLGTGFMRPTPKMLTLLMDRLREAIPPQASSLESDGSPKLENLETSQVLYAGWAYWIGRAHLSDSASLGFFETNRLCDLALLQQRAINLKLAASTP